MNKRISNFKFQISNYGGFTLIELLVVVTIIGIIIVAVVVALNPTKRISDAQVAAISSQTSSIGSAYDICLNYVNTTLSPAVQNTAVNCGFGGGAGTIATTLSSGSGTPAGGPFLKAAPTSGTFSITAAGTTNINGCINGTNGSYWAQYRSNDNSVITGSTGVPSACP